MKKEATNKHAPIEITIDMVKERIGYYEQVLKNPELTPHQVQIHSKLLAFWQNYKLPKKKE